VLSRGGGPTDWAQLLEPLPFFEGFKHFLQARTQAASPPCPPAALSCEPAEPAEGR
jgi:hypothetical protein